MIVEKAGNGHRQRRKREHAERIAQKEMMRKEVVQISEGVTLIHFTEERPNKSMMVKKVDFKTLPKYQRGFADWCGNAGGGARFMATIRDKRNN